MNNQLHSTDRFCENCGAPINPNAAFCENCGIRITDSNEEIQDCFAETKSTDTTPLKTDEKNFIATSMPTQSTPDSSMAIPTEKVMTESKTTVMPVMEPSITESTFVAPQIPLDPPPTQAQAPLQSSDTNLPHKKTRLSKITLICCVIIFMSCLGALLGLAITKPPIPFLAGTPFSSSKTADQLKLEALEKQVKESNDKLKEEQNKKSDNQNSSSKTYTKDQIDLMKNQYELLHSAWIKLGDINEQLVKEVSEFNSGWKSGNVPSFQDIQEQIIMLQTTVSPSILNSLSDTNARSDYYMSSSELIHELIDDLQKRTDVLMQASDMVKAGSPQSDILALLGRDNLSNGVNKYKDHFEKNYNRAEPPALPSN